MSLYRDKIIDVFGKENSAASSLVSTESHGINQLLGFCPKGCLYVICDTFRIFVYKIYYRNDLDFALMLSPD